MTVNNKPCCNANYQKASRTSIQYLVIHYTGNLGDTAAGNAGYFARETGLGASAHYFVDENEIWQSVPDGCIAWHCGCKTGYFHPTCRNKNSIGIEICMLDKNGGVRQESIDRAAELARYLMKRYGIPIDRVVRHYDVTHKNCPAPMVQTSALWLAFKQSLEGDTLTYEQFKTFITRYEKERQALPVHDWAAGAWAAMTAAGITDGTTPQSPLTREQYAVMRQREKA